MLKLLLIREMSGTKLEEQRTRFLTVSLEEAVGREGEERETEVCVGFVGLVATVLSNTRSSGQGGFISRKDGALQKSHQQQGSSIMWARLLPWLSFPLASK